MKRNARVVHLGRGYRYNPTISGDNGNHTTHPTPRNKSRGRNSGSLRERSDNSSQELDKWTQRSDDSSQRRRHRSSGDLREGSYNSRQGFHNSRQGFHNSRQGFHNSRQGFHNSRQGFHNSREKSSENQLNFKRPKPMGFKQLEELLQNDDMEDILLQVNGNNRFKELLESKELSGDIMVLIALFLAKICNSPFQQSLISILQLALRSAFITQLIHYISTISLQNDQDKTQNRYYWKDSDELFWNSVIVFVRKCHHLMPTASCSIILKLLTAAKQSIPCIENCHSVHISDQIKEAIDSLHQQVEHTVKEAEVKKKEVKKQQVKVYEEPPDDFREIDVYPNVAEITMDTSPFLRKNVVKGPYRDIDHYLDVQFRLVREDFVKPLRNGICQYLKNPKVKFDDIKIYTPVRFLCVEVVNEQDCYRIQINFLRKQKINFEKSKRFLYGCLVCFTRDNFQTVLFGRIANRDVDLLKKGELVVGFDQDVVLPEDLYQHDYVMVESVVYFEPYFHVLNALKTLQSEDFAMEQYIIQVKTRSRPPSYLLTINPKYYTIEGNRFSPLDWPTTKFYGFNDSQLKAFQAGLSQEFAVIQGPPGTGKTFLGLKIAQVFLENRSVWYRQNPILVICYTNHALDQFLEGLLDFTDAIVRVGGQSKNETLKEFNLKSKKIDVGQNYINLRNRMRNYTSLISNVNAKLHQMEAYDVVVDFRMLKSLEESWFSAAKKADIMSWLQITEIHNQTTNGPLANLSKNTDVNFDDEEGDRYEEAQCSLLEEFLGSQRKSNVEVHPIISLRELMQMETWINQQINVETSNNNFFMVEQLNYELFKVQRTTDYLKEMLKKGTQILQPQVPRFVDLKNPFRMALEYRWEFYFYCVDQYKKQLQEEKERLGIEFRDAYREFSEMREILDVQIMKTALVVGMTTTGAARLRATLQALQSPIVIVEEAAEVLEAHITASLTSACRHLILIGDHQQLKPSTANYQIETQFQLGISLFERMILNDVPHNKLEVQHRMRPEISSLIRPAIYPVLEDHQSVLNRPSIRGIENCVYFIDHEKMEDACIDNSKKNVHEAEFLILLARHLILNGYGPQQITILASYLGQMFELRELKKAHDLLLKDVRIAVLDNYQGEECDIILLSLVRNNTEGNIGFLKIENRVCVALSRAKYGLYIMGNMKVLCDNSTIWPKVRDVLEGQDALGPYLSLRCQIHQNRVTHIQNPEEFLTKCSEGGCDKLCGVTLTCGHVCKNLCHIRDRDHQTSLCYEKCTRLLCDNPTHLCKKLCHQECGNCTYLIRHELECGHSADVPCHMDPDEYNCVEIVNVTLSCGHNTDKPCHKDAETFPCPHPCDIRVEPCGHACRMKCHYNKDPDHLEYKCTKNCAKYRRGCTNRKDEAHLCHKMCSEPCDECTVTVLKLRTVCSHAFKVACTVDVDSIECEKPCKRNMDCGHICYKKCHEPCRCLKIVEKVLPECGHRVKTECYRTPEPSMCRKKCSRLLPCGHVCYKKCGEICTTKCRQKVDCEIPSPCGHVVKRILCYLKNSQIGETLLDYCTEKCTTVLRCGHPCTGSCNTCRQGRIHQRCTQKCGATLICNHECPIPCSSLCKPCEKPCEYRCKHSKCGNKCGVPCTSCKEECSRRCEHARCEKKCFELCDVPPCKERCKKKLKCGHPCVGFCGDPCPKLCLTCNTDELTEIFFGNEDEENAIYVMLQECGHVFESEGLENWMAQTNEEISAKFCPKCKTTIKSTQRYSDYIKQNMNDIIKVKERVNGSYKEIEVEKAELFQLIDNIQIVRELRDTADALKVRLLPARQVDRKRFRQNINKMEISAIKTKVQILNILRDLMTKNTLTVSHFTPPVIQIVSSICNVLTDNMDTITQQEVDDISLETDRLTRRLQFDKINEKLCLRGIVLESKINEIKKLLELPARYDSARDEEIKVALKKIKSQVEIGILITEQERKEIVTALGLSRGHWFKCPNGHPYVITECGGAMEISTCPDCGVQIGGRNHALLPGQQLAREMDGASHAAWSEAANLGNYLL